MTNTKPIIPVDAREQHIAVLGKSGSGKTFAMKAAHVEPLLEAGKLVAIVDPTSAWWGLRSSADGKGAGFKVLVLGGDHGDLPLPANGGAAIARLIVEQGVSVVLDTGNLSVGERTRWMIDFAGALYRLNRAPLYLVLDEAHVFAPQGGGGRMDPDVGKMLHVVNQLASGGRSRGIRLTLITQRPQKLHKDTLTTADTLIAMRVHHPLDRAAVKDWIDGCGDAAQGKQVLDSLAGLQRGEGWVWYPEGAHLARVKFPPIRTFDSSATPTEGQAVATPKATAIDLTEIKAALADAVKEAEANDPKLLRARIAELERQGSQSRKPNDLELEATRAESFRSGVAEGRLQTARGMGGYFDRLATLALALSEHAQAGQQDLAKVVAGGATVETPRAVGVAAPRRASASPAQPSAPPARANGAGAVSDLTKLSRAEQRILTALAQYPQGRTKNQVAMLAGYAVNGGGFSNALSSLRTSALIEGGPDRLRILPAGMSSLGPFDPLPTGRALLAHWYGQLSKAERKALEAVAEVYPRSLSKVQVANRAGYEANGGGFNNALSRLRTLELISGKAEIKASDAFFQ